MNNEEESLNIFAKPIILKKRKHDLKAWLMKLKLLRKMDTISPSFDTMLEIWKFIYIARSAYMHSYYDGSPLHLFIGTTPKEKNSFNTHSMIYKDKTFSIIFVLEERDKRINIEINRSLDNRNNAEKISFKDGEYEYKNLYDEEKFRTIVSCLMNGTKELINYYYKNKRF